MSSLRVKAHEIIENISDKKIAEVVDFLEYLKIKEEVEATNEILSDKKLLDSIQKGLAQIEKGELVELDDVIEDV
jgi:predicted transcriptional regulator